MTAVLFIALYIQKKPLHWLGTWVTEYFVQNYCLKPYHWYQKFTANLESN